MILNADIRYKSGKTGLPIVIVLHGFGGDASYFDADTKKRFAENNVFAIFINLRGRNGSEGTQDCSAREIYDIIDCINHVKINYASIIDPDHIHIVGYSGGGGNAIACAAKFPDYFNTVTSFFGISDYGYDAVDGWYNNGADVTQKALMDTWVGDNPTNVPNSYYARYHLGGITNFTGGFLNLLQDEDDSIVPVINNQNIADVMDVAGLTNYIFRKSAAGSSLRWVHGYPNSDDSPNIIIAEPLFVNPIIAKTYPAWIIPASGSVKVIGYIKTKRFTIWLGGLAEAAVGAGLNEVATVVYNTTTGQYTVTPLTGNMDVFIKQGNLIASQSITEETILTVT